MNTNDNTKGTLGLTLDDIVRYVTFSGSIKSSVNYSPISVVYDTAAIYNERKS